MLGIAHSDQLEGFWSSEVHPKIGIDALTLPPGADVLQGTNAPQGAVAPGGADALPRC
jgi:hypothetical protein